MKKILFTIFMVALLLGTVQAANRYGDTYHEVDIVDETGRPVTDITNLYIYLAGTTTDATIYSDKARQNTITIPMTESSTNTTLVDGKFYYWGPDKYDFSMTNSEGVGPRTNSGHEARGSNEGTLVFPSYLQSISSTSYTDSQSITMGTGSDWVINSTASTLGFTPAGDDQIFNVGTSGTSLNANFNVFTGTDLGFKLSSSGATHSMTYDGGIVNLNANSNFAVNICSGTSTGATTIGNSAGGAVSVDTDSTININADDSINMTTSGAAADIDIDAAAGSVIIDGGEATADAVGIVSTGGIDLTSSTTYDIDITATGGKILMNATENDAGAISMTVNGGTSETIVITNTQGTGAGAITATATAGSIDINSGDNVTIDSADDTTIDTADGGISLIADGATNGDVTLDAEDDIILTTTGKLTITNTEAMTVSGATTLTGAATATAGIQASSVGVTATTDGLTTGLIPSGTSFVTVTSDSADKVVVLPAAVIGNVIWITVPATGCELETLATTNTTINTVDCDGTNQLALVAGSIYRAVCTKAITYVVTGASTLGANEDSLTPNAD